MPRPVGPKGAKSAALSLRLTPRTRYGLTLLARVNRLSLGQIVEEALENCFYGEGPGTLERRLSGTDKRIPVLDTTWDERPWVRLGKLALLGPELLTAPELRLWETLSRTASYWRRGKPPHKADELSDVMVHSHIETDWPELSKDVEVGI